jgi:hypothetical protein
MSEIFAAIGLFVVAIPAALLAGVLFAIWRAWWLYPAWAWFLIPLGVPNISFWHFTALQVLITTLTKHIEDKKDDRKTDWTKLIIIPLLMPVFAWVVMRWLR